MSGGTPGGPPVIPLSPTGGLLSQLRLQLQTEVEQIKSDLGQVLTEVNSKVARVETGLHDLNEAGRRIAEQLETQKAEATTHIHEVIDAANSEFDKHREAVEQTHKEAMGTKQEIGK